MSISGISTRWTTIGGICTMLAVAAVSGCDVNSGVVNPTPTSTRAVVRNTPTPSPTRIPPTATSTATLVSTPSPESLAIADDPTATWTPVPGNPRWSVWAFGDVDFLLPVAWQRHPDTDDGIGRYRAPGGGEQPRMSVAAVAVPSGVDVVSYAESRHDSRVSSSGDAELLAVDPFETDQVSGYRYAYGSRVVDAGGASRDVRVYAFYAVEDGVAVEMEFSVDAGIGEQWATTFDQIARSMWIGRTNGN